MPDLQKTTSNPPKESRKGRGVCLCWAASNLEGPEGLDSWREKSRPQPRVSIKKLALLRLMAVVASSNYHALRIAARYGRTEVFQQLLAEELEIEEAGESHGPSSLHEAAIWGHDDVANLLLEHGAQVSARQRGGGASPLHYAAFHGHEATVLLLLEHTADVSPKDNAGRTPLHAASSRGHEEVVRLLLGKGADLQPKTNAGRTPEDLATVHSHPQIAAMIKAEEVSREEVRMTQCVAFAMGHHERLGVGSPVQELDAGVVGMVLEQV